MSQFRPTQPSKCTCCAGGKTCSPLVLLLVVFLLISCTKNCKSEEHKSQPQRDKQNQTASQKFEASELSFEFLALRQLPGASELCTIEAQNLNSVSFANNWIEQIGAKAFVCIGKHLKILNLSNNRIALISREAFVKLHQLQVLLLDGNQIATIPSVALQPLVTLRHLNLASNRIESISAADLNQVEPNVKKQDLEAQVDPLRICLPNLISLNVRSNPVRTIERRAFERLPKLKTLTLSQIRVASWRALWPLVGLGELRFLHLDRAFVAQNSSASLKLHANEEPLEFDCAHAPKLTSVDLSYNQIRGSLDGGQLRQLGALLDLYLGHNAIESIGARAFESLERLQVLELQANRLTSVHELAFATGSALLELNVAQNERLSELPLPADTRLQVLWAYGNPALRTLPRLEHARRLSLTYAYHCCDYQTDLSPAATLEEGFLVQEQLVQAEAEFWPVLSAEQQQQQQQQPSASIWTRLAGLFFQSQQTFHSPPSGGFNGNDTSNEIPPDWRARHYGSTNLADLVVWPTSGDSQPHAKHPSHYSGDEDARGEQDKANKASYHLKRAHLIDGRRSRHRRRARLASKSSGAQNYIEAAQEAASGGAYQHHSEATTAAIGEPQLQMQHPNNVHLRPARGVSGRVDCVPRPNAFMPCQDLFDSWWLRAGVWAVFASSFAGNLLVIIVLASARPSSSSSALANLMWFAGHSKRHIDVPRFLVINLAFADLLMALYLALLAAVDLRTLGEFRLHAIKWQHSAGCRLAAFLAVLSSELSVFILAIITLERNYAITNAVHLNRRLSLQKAMLIMFAGYTFALAMALGPLQGISDYRKFSVCLPLDFETNPWSRAYVLTLVAINSLSFLMLLGCYLRMYCAIRGSQAWNTNDLKIAKRMSVLIFTDFLCWMPIILVACFALAGHYLVGPRGLKVLTVFILPLNSVANPFLYAITTKKFKRDLVTLKRRMAKLVMVRRQQPSGSCFAQHPNLGHRCAAAAVVASGQQWKLDRPEGAVEAIMGQSEQVVAVQRSLRCHRGGQQQQQQRAGRTSGKRQRAQNNSKQVQTALQPNFMVTVNRTTACCSCGRLMATAQPPSTNGGPQLLARHQVAVQVKLSSASSQRLSTAGVAQQISQELSSRPRIVLDSVCEPPAIDTLALSALASTSRLSGATANLESGQQRSEECSLLGSKLLNCAASTNELAAASDQPSCYCSPPFEPTLASKHLASCQTLQSPPTDRLAVEQLPSQNGDRCASACAFHGDWPAAHSNQGELCARADSCHMNQSTFASRGAKRAQESPSGAESKRKATTGGNKLSRSISRLLFGPIARAWSSIQFISLHSIGGGGGGGAPAAQAERNGARSEGSSPAPNSPPAPLQQQAEQCNCKYHGKECDAVIIDDILLLSSPARRRLLQWSQQQQRRMSRSCDQLTANTSTHMTNLCGAAESTTSADSQLLYGANDSQQQTATSSTNGHSGAGDDDRRILLATINKFATHAGKQGQSGQLRVISKLAGEQHGQRLKCTARCRSWSPALLGKLEDCIHQIKEKLCITKLPNSNRKQSKAGVCRGEGELSRARTPSLSPSPSNTDDLDQRYGQMVASETEESEDEDEFNEIALNEWRQRWKTKCVDRQQVKGAGKLHHQSSGASENFSLKTTGTTSTTMGSFDLNVTSTVEEQQVPTGAEKQVTSETK